MSPERNAQTVREYIGHGGREEYSPLWAHDAPQQIKWHFSLYEVAIDLEVDLGTGESRIVAVDGKQLQEPTAWV